MDKATAVQKVKEALEIEPQPEDENGRVVFVLNGVYLCHVEGGGTYANVIKTNSAANADCVDFDRFTKRLSKKLELGRKAAGVVVPESCEVDLTGFEYLPGGKWDCGILNLHAETSLGPFTWEEIVPGPRHGEDHAELTVTLNGQKIDLFEHGLELDFEPPNKEGRWSEQFMDSEDEVAEQLFSWFEDNKEVLAILAGG